VLVTFQRTAASFLRKKPENIFWARKIESIPVALYMFLSDLIKTFSSLTDLAEKILWRVNNYCLPAEKFRSTYEQYNPPRHRFLHQVASTRRGPQTKDLGGLSASQTPFRPGCFYLILLASKAILSMVSLAFLPA
jgi:hypothetical protein